MRRLAAPAEPLSAKAASQYLQPFLAHASAVLADLKIAATINKRQPWLPRLHNAGVDLSFMLTAPALRKATLCFSWDSDDTPERWENLLQLAAEPRGVTLLWNGTLYYAKGLKLPPFLQAVGVLGVAKPHPATAPPFNGVLSWQSAEMLKSKIQTYVCAPVKKKDKDGVEESVPPDDATKSTRLGEIAQIDKLGLDSALQAAATTLGSTGISRLIAPDRTALLRCNYKPLNFDTSIGQLTARLSRNKYKGQVVGLVNPNGQIVIHLNAPLPILLACKRGGGTALGPLAVALVLSESTVLAAPTMLAQPLVMGSLTLGLAARLALQGPAQTVQRGRLRLKLDPAQAAAVQAATASGLIASEE